VKVPVGLQVPTYSPVMLPVTQKDPIVPSVDLLGMCTCNRTGTAAMFLPCYITQLIRFVVCPHFSDYRSLE